MAMRTTISSRARWASCGVICSLSIGKPPELVLALSQLVHDVAALLARSPFVGFLLGAVELAVDHTTTQLGGSARADILQLVRQRRDRHGERALEVVEHSLAC